MPRIMPRKASPASRAWRVWRPWRDVLRALESLLRSVLPSRPWPHDRGEQAAARYLIALDWELLEANIRVGHDEGDLLALDRFSQPVLVEVKSSHGGPVAPELQVGPAKAARLRRLAMRLAGDPRCLGRVPRIDVITVALRDEGDRVTHHFVSAVEDGPPPKRRGLLRP